MTDEPIEVVDGEQVDGVPILAEARVIDRPAAVTSLPAVQAAAAAATGFVAGAATLAVFRRRQARRRGLRKSPRAVGMLPVTGSRTFLVQVHRLGRPEE
jgi:hypothetical protein